MKKQNMIENETHYLQILQKNSQKALLYTFKIY